MSAMRGIRRSLKWIPLVLSVLLAAGCAKSNQKPFLPNENFAEEFASDPIAARKKYISGEGVGPTVGVISSVQKIDGNTIQLVNNGKIGIVLRAKSLVGKMNSDKDLTVYGIGRITDFDEKTVFVECAEVRVGEMVPVPIP